MQQFLDKAFNKEMFSKLDSEHISDFSISDSHGTKAVVKEKKIDKSTDKEISNEISSKLHCVSKRSSGLLSTSHTTEPVMNRDGKNKSTSDLQLQLDTEDDDSKLYILGQKMLYLEIRLN